MNKNVAAIRIKRELPSTEAGIDTALLQVNSLMNTLVTARLEADVPAATGHDVLLHMVKVQAALIDASAQLARVHSKMARIGREMGIGDVDECPPRTAIADKSLQIAA